MLLSIMVGVGKRRASSPSSPGGITHATVHDVVRCIPAGWVATYGDVAAMAGFPGRARYVGYALHGLAPGQDVPWHRVINARGEISLPEASPARGEQIARLRAEGVEVDDRGRTSLRKYRWL